MCNTTEHIKVVEEGIVILVGMDKTKIITEANNLLKLNIISKFKEK